MNFLYLTSPQARYVIDNRSPVSFALFNGLPELINKDYLNYSAIVDKNNYKVRIVSVNGPYGNPPLVRGTTLVNVVPVTPADRLDGFGEVEFYEATDTGWLLTGKSYYVGLASLYGAIYSEDELAYDCNMKKAFKRFGLLNTIYYNRTEELIRYYSFHADPQNCASLLDSALIEIGAVYGLDKFDYSNARLLQTHSTNMMVENKKIQRYSCPVIY
jgi:hypothetical protein